MSEQTKKKRMIFFVKAVLMGEHSIYLKSGAGIGSEPRKTSL